MEGLIHTPGFFREYHESPMRRLFYEDYFIYILREDDKETYLHDLTKPALKSRAVKTTECLFVFDAVKCAAAVLNGETSPVIDYNAAFCHDGLPALHNAARYQSPKLTELFLAHNGAEADLRWDCEAIGMKGMQLPLNIALEKFRLAKGIYGWDWNRTNSVFKLIFRFFCYDVGRYLETVRLLSQMTIALDKEILYYAREGKVVELAALLMVASDKVMTTPLPVENKFWGRTEPTTIRPFVLAEIASLSVFDARSRYARLSKTELQEQRTKKIKLEQTLLLLEIFERIGEQLSMYFRLKRKDFEKLAHEVAWIFEEGGFDVTFDIFEDIQRKVAGSDWCCFYLDELCWLCPQAFRPWKTFFNDVENSYEEFPTKRSYQQAMSADRRYLFNERCVFAPFDKCYVPQLRSRSYHFSPEVGPVTFGKNIKNVQNLKFHKLVVMAFTRALKGA